MIKKDEQQETDKEVDAFVERWSGMSRDLNGLGAGIYLSLRDVKRSFQTNTELAMLIDELYNGTLSHYWPEVNSVDHLKQHGAAARFRESWHQSHYQIRPAAASEAVERTLNSLRSFSLNSVPQIKKEIQERRAAELDLGSYARRYDAMKRSQNSGGMRLAPLSQKLENAKARYAQKNAALKDNLVKEKIMRDRLIEDALVTIVVAQHEMYKELSANLQDIVSSLPREKVLSIKKKISDTVAVGGPSSDSSEISGITKAMQVAAGLKTASDFHRDAAEEEVASAKRMEAGTALALMEEGMLQKIPPPAPSTATAARDVCWALYDCEAEAVDDLSFKVNDKILVISREEPGGAGWWHGKNVRTGDVGIFPANYISWKEG